MLKLLNLSVKQIRLLKTQKTSGWSTFNIPIYLFYTVNPAQHNNLSLGTKALYIKLIGPEDKPPDLTKCLLAGTQMRKIKTCSSAHLMNFKAAHLTASKIFSIESSPILRKIKQFANDSFCFYCLPSGNNILPNKVPISLHDFKNLSFQYFRFFLLPLQHQLHSSHRFCFGVSPHSLLYLSKDTFSYCCNATFSDIPRFSAALFSCPPNTLLYGSVASYSPILL